MLWLLPVIPFLGGLAVWCAGRRWSRSLLATAALGLGTGTTVLAVWALLARPSVTYVFGPELRLLAQVDVVSGTAAVLVATIATIIMGYAALHEEREMQRGLHRLMATLLLFVGAMLLLVIAADLVTLLIGWELVGAMSWALIGFHWREADKPAAAAHAFNATRFGDLGLFLAAAAAFAGTESFAYADLAALSGTPLAVLVAGIVLSATAKSGQLAFAPWLFSAMGGPTSVSALLHSSTMVAAGAYLLIRLHPVLDAEPWFGPTVVGIGLVTALSGGVVASLQSHIKKLLAASTSAHYGFMFIAVGAGYPLVALAHLVVHAIFKAHLFLAAGVAMEAVGSPQLGRMRLGSLLPWTARMSLVSVLALAAVVPLGGAWTKDEVLAAAAHQSGWTAVGVLVAGGMSAIYATRFQVLAFGRSRGDVPSPQRLRVHPGSMEITAMALLTAGSVVVSLVWLPPVNQWVNGLLTSGLPEGQAWELPTATVIAIAAIYLTWNADRRGRLAAVGMTGAARAAADWLALPRIIERLVVAPTLALAAGLARFDDRVVDAGVRGAGRAVSVGARTLGAADNRVVDAGVRGVAAIGTWGARITSTFGERGVEGTVAAIVAGIGGAGSDSRRMQTGMAHHYYVIISAGLIVLVTVAALGR